MNIAQFALGLVLSLPHPAYGGAVLLCNPYGCRSSPYYPPPVVMTQPPMVYVPASPGRPPGRPRAGDPSQEQVLVAPRTPAPRRQAERPPQKDAQAAEIENDIMAFCDEHPDEPFCGKLGSYLRNHPR